tara:strand:- start:1208 stop:1939 length:732 start_codon:yes stop_codon:yes gene_type:complete
MDKQEILGSSISVVLLMLLLLIVVIIIIKMVKAKSFKFWKKSPKQKEPIKTTQVIAFEQPPSNMICKYNIDFNVFFTGSSQEVITLLDRKSPIIKLDMANGSIIIDYLAAVNSDKLEASKNDVEPDTGTIVTQSTAIDNTDSLLEVQTCVCPSIKTPEFSAGQQFAGVFPTTMQIITPAIPFQKDNSLEIVQNLRDIEIYLNGEFLHSTLLEYVPFLFPGKGKALPYNSPYYMHINKISFEKI